MFVRRSLALARRTPLVFSLTDGWTLGPEPEVCLDFVYLRTGCLLNAARLMISGTLEPFAALCPDDPTVQLIAQQFTGLQATLTMLADGPPTGPAGIRAGGRR